jgi:hypothetical protein
MGRSPWGTVDMRERVLSARSSAEKLQGGRPRRPVRQNDVELGGAELIIIIQVCERTNTDGAQSCIARHDLTLGSSPPKLAGTDNAKLVRAILLHA